MGLADWWAGWRSRYEALVEEYGGIAIGTYFTLFFGTWFGFWVAVRSGFQASETATMGTVGLAWVLTKTTQPVRIGATVVLTPLVVRLRRRLTGGAPTPPAA
jgi:hypothetical protein